MTMTPKLFALPVWPRGLRDEMNVFVGFRFVLPEDCGDSLKLRLTATSAYRVWLDGEYVGSGPARGPHGRFRIDEWELSGLHQRAGRVLAVEVASYHVFTYYIPKQPPFLVAEVVRDGMVVAATGHPEFRCEAFRLAHHVQKVQRFSFQRSFTEVLRLAPDWDVWRRGGRGPGETLELETLPAVDLLPRRLAPFSRTIVGPARQVLAGEFEANQPVPNRIHKHDPAVHYEGWPDAELDAIPSRDVETSRVVRQDETVRNWQPDDGLTLTAGIFTTWEFGPEKTGFIKLNARTSGPARLVLVWNDKAFDKELGMGNLNAVSVAEVRFDAAGDYAIELFEPVSVKFLKTMVFEGTCRLSGIGIREAASADYDGASFACSDVRLNRIFEGARETLRQNACDVFMDCPSRERAGWLCDSFFSARVAHRLSGHTRLEKNHLENFLLAPPSPWLPAGMIPMCYPADHRDGNFIPNWAMWLFIELEEYLARSGDHELVAAFRAKFDGLCDYFIKFENSDGLLEKLEKWVFVEWSKANEFSLDVNYPTNMLYAAMLETGARLYGRGELGDKAARIKQAIRAQSFDGEYFVDNAVRQDGRLVPTRNRTETCQYYAFYFGVATPSTHAALWRRLEDEFGPSRRATGRYPDIHHANAFIGNYLRLELLSRHGGAAQVLKEIAGYFLQMVDATGTLWEHDSTAASCNHGFASHVGYVLLRDALGIAQVNTVDRELHLVAEDLLSRVPLEFCEGGLPVEDGWIRVRWWKDDGGVRRQIAVPAGYRVATAGGGEETRK